ncbi:MAG TPA: permease [Chthoniobacterales bacterium]
MPGWFNFSFPDFCYSFLSVLLEGVPFILLGTAISGLIDQFLPARLMSRLLPRNPFLGACVSGLLGMIFPMCECAVVPVIRRLIAKGLPLSHAVTYMLAAPIVNPIVALSTYAAFRGQGAGEMTAFRLGLGFAVAVLAGLAVHHLAPRSVLRPRVLESALAFGASSEMAPAPLLGMKARLSAALRVTVGDFLDVMLYFIIGAAIAAVFNTSVNQDALLPLALNPWLATGSMMGLALMLSLCSTSDAFIAATFGLFPWAARLAFLVFGPMMDLKLLFIYSSVFRPRFVIGLAIGLFILIGLLCIRLGGVLNL